MSEALARAGYSALLFVATPLYLLRLWWRGRHEALYRHAIAERLGYGQGVPGRIWIHAVSLGETRAAAALLDALRRARPQTRFLLTHGTATGREAGRALLHPGDAQAWLPWDTPGAVRRFLHTHKPLLGVVMETEVWPNLLAGAQAAGLTMVLANARLSPQSEAKGRRLAVLMHPALARFSAVFAQTDADAARLAASGARAVEVMGNLKFDMTPDPVQVERGRAWRQTVARPVVLAASTREGEEAPLLHAWRALPAPRPLLVVVPRHPQRFEEVAAALGAAGLTYRRRSSWREAAPHDAVDAWLGDSIGEMATWYALADVALLGGSFAPLGGQNLIEAAACGCPVVMGPHTFNFAQAAEDAVAAGAARRVPNLEHGVEQAAALATDPKRGLDVAHSLGFAARHRGAAERMARAILLRLSAAPAA